MAIDLNAVGSSTDPSPVSWTAKDAMLYALGVGASVNPSEELAFTTENTTGIALQALPTFAVVLGWDAPRPSYGEVDASRLVAAEISVALHRPLPVEGKALIDRRIEGIYDKGSGALVRTCSTLSDPETGDVLAEVVNAGFIRGAGGFGGDRGSANPWDVPDREPDAVVSEATSPSQALLYRLSGDRNPLHSDPSFATRAGFERPILHGLCTFGFAGRAVLHQAAGSDPSRVRAISARFSSPVIPGDTLTTSVWVSGTDVWFRVHVGDRLVLDHGRAEVVAS